MRVRCSSGLGALVWPSGTLLLPLAALRHQLQPELQADGYMVGLFARLSLNATGREQGFTAEHPVYLQFSYKRSVADLTQGPVNLASIE
eukprot:5864935-Amphidinium_carterae.3